MSGSRCEYLIQPESPSPKPESLLEVAKLQNRSQVTLGNNLFIFSDPFAFNIGLIPLLTNLLFVLQATKYCWPWSESPAQRQLIWRQRWTTSSGSHLPTVGLWILWTKSLLLHSCTSDRWFIKERLAGFCLFSKMGTYSDLHMTWNSLCRPASASLVLEL